MGIGILAGLALSGPAAQAATTITATFSDRPVYVDGQHISMIAYSAGGNNYVRLRDIGKAVNFGVTYDTVANSVHIDSTQPYQGEAPQIIPAPLEERVQVALAQLKERYPSGHSLAARASDPAGQTSKPHRIRAETAPFRGGWIHLFGADQLEQFQRRLCP